MDKKEFDLIREEGEGLKAEFKESFDAKSLAKEIAAFANSEGGRIFLGVDDRVEVYNKGRLLFDKKDLGKISLSRNPIIFDLFHRVDLIEKAGSGINRIKELAKERGLKIMFETDEFFRIVFERIVEKAREKESGRISGGLNEGLNEGLKSLLEVISKNKGIKAKECSEKLDRPIKTIERQIKGLIEKGLIERRGSKKTGGYFIKNVG